MKQTPNLSLKQPDLTDVVNIEDLNQNFDTIDTEIKSAKDRADEAFQSASDGKGKIATAITGKGIPTSSSDTFQVMATNIKAIETDKTGDATAVTGDILAVKTAYAKGVKLIGTMPNNGSVGTKNLTTEGAEYSIPAGYHNGLGKVKAVITGLIASVIKAGTTVGGIVGTFTNDADAIASNILSGKTAYVKGAKVTGTMTNRDYAWTLPRIVAPSSDGIHVIPQEGWYAGSDDIYVRGGVKLVEPNLTSANILSGKSIFGVSGSANPKKIASGIANVSASVIGLTRVDGVASQSYTISIPNLTFIPTKIIIWNIPGNNTIYDYVYITTYIKGQNLAVTGGDITVTYTRADSAGGYAYIVSGGTKINLGDIVLPVTFAQIPYNWVAYE